MTTEEIVKAIDKATNGTFIAPNSSTTLLGWIDVYDDEGRMVSVDPNYKSGSVDIEGTTYPLVRKGWDVYIFKPEYPNARYTWVMADKKDCYLTTFNIKPDYVKTYEEKQEMKRLEKEKELVNNGKNICNLVIKEDSVYQLRTHNGAFAMVEFGRIPKKDLGNGCYQTNVIKETLENCKSFEWLDNIHMCSIYNQIGTVLEKYGMVDKHNDAHIYIR